MMTLAPLHREDAQAVPSGRAMFDGVNCQYGDAVKAGDLVAANFDEKRVSTGGGLYLLESLQDGAVAWRGCRRLMKVPAEISIDLDGHGDWTTLPSLEDCGWRVAGRVEKVYRPALTG
jgi:hypothetical protein